jgi:hypothetical protein
MSNVQFYFAIGLPSLLALVNMAVMLILFTSLSRAGEGRPHDNSGCLL